MERVGSSDYLQQAAVAVLLGDKDRAVRSVIRSSDRGYMAPGSTTVAVVPCPDALANARLPP